MIYFTSVSTPALRFRAGMGIRSCARRPQPRDGVFGLIPERSPGACPGSDMHGTQDGRSVQGLGRRLDMPTSCFCQQEDLHLWAIVCRRSLSNQATVDMRCRVLKCSSKCSSFRALHLRIEAVGTN